ncbi:MAG TPA: hybrid sensor histidine kinase/response regulator [Spirochaetia bacterium]|jgi:two-component system sensor histidine kinase EvgS|nr:hybrid sensor histidine kinase/response regulator [Spirochaetia bacterium]
MISLPFVSSRHPEALLLEILGSSREAVAAEGLDGRVAFVNDRFLELVGATATGRVTRLDDYLARWIQAAAHPRVLEAYFQACRSDRPPEGPRELEPHPGQVVEARFKVIRGPRRSTYRVWYFQEWRTSALAWVSHEIKNPLNAVLGFTELLEETLEGSAPQESTRVSLRGLKTSARHLHSVLGDLLDLSRLESGTVELRPAWVAVDAFVEDLDALFRARFHRRGIEFRLRRAETRNLEVWIDQGRLSQVLGNLLANALRYTKQGWVCLEVNQTSGGWEFAVEDTGMGIPADQQKSIFEPFVQHQGNDQPRSGGAGLGLAICRTLTQSLGGQLGLSSTPGIGSRFTVSFEHLETRVQGAPNSVPSPKSIPPVTLLLADDEQTNHLLVKGFLRGTPVTVLSAGDGHEAVELWERHRPPVVLMDLRMPGLTGSEAARRIRERDPRGRSRLLAMSAFYPQGSEALPEPHLWAGFLEKPFAKGDFLNFLSNHVTFVDESGRSP